MSPAELLCYQVAARQAGYVTRKQALACGMTDEIIRGRLVSGLWRPLRPGVYLIQGHPPTLRGRLLAATAALNAVVSHESAAEIHKFPGIPTGKAVVTVPVRTTNRFPDVVVRQSTDLTRIFVVEVEGMPVTTPIRTVIDLAPDLAAKALGRLVDHLVLKSIITISELDAAVSELSRRGKPGMKKCHVVLEARADHPERGDSFLEKLVISKFIEWGFPQPICQYPLPWWTRRPGRVDFAYPAIRLIIEADGRAWHSSLEAFEEDRMRDNLAQLANWRVLRVTYRMLIDRPEEVREMVRRALGPLAA
jgi:hypothetical protein